MKAPSYLLPLLLMFDKNRNEQDAIYMKKYMKGRYDYFGIKAPLRKDLERKFRQLHGGVPSDNLQEMLYWCWQAPERELQYFAMERLGRSAKNVAVSQIELYEHMLIEKSWWDTVDYIAVNLVGTYFTQYPDQIPRITNTWMASENIWLQRSCLLFQLKYKSRTDLKLLDAFIQELKTSKEFFIRKAIGWVLREYSKTDADYVTSYVSRNELSGLSEREALKWMKNRNK